MMKSLRRRLTDARDWVRAMRHYRRNNHFQFLEAVDTLARRKPLTGYQIALRANALLLSGRHKEAIALYSTLLGEEGEGPKTVYISLYARAMLANINGDQVGYARNAKAALSLRLPFISKLLFHQNLPL